MEILAEIKRIKELMSINESVILSESSLPKTIVSATIKSAWRAASTLGDSNVIERTLISTIDDATKDALKFAYKTSFGVTDDAVVNSLKLTDLINNLINLPAGQWSDDVIKSLLQVYNGIPRVSEALTTGLSKSTDIVDNFKELQKLMDDGLTTYDNILSELSDEIGANNAKKLLSKVKLTPGIVDSATKITLELSQIIKNVIESPSVPKEIQSLMKSKSGFINECISLALKSTDTIDFNKFVEILNKAYSEIPSSNKIDKNQFVELVKKAFLKEKDKPVEFGNIAKTRIYTLMYLPIVGLIAAYTLDEKEQLYFDKCFSEKGYSDEDVTLGNQNKLPSDKQVQYDVDVSDCNDTAYSEEIVGDTLDFLQLALPGAGSGIVYLLKGYKPEQRKPKQRGVEKDDELKPFIEFIKKDWIDPITQKSQLTNKETYRKDGDDFIVNDGIEDFKYIYDKTQNKFIEKK